MAARSVGVGLRGRWGWSVADCMAVGNNSCHWQLQQQKNRRCQTGSTTTTPIATTIATTTTMQPLPELVYHHSRNDDDDRQHDQHDLDFWKHSFQPFYQQQRPVVVRGGAMLLRHSKCLQRWHQLSYWETHVPQDVMCDVEMGTYNNDASNSQHMTIPFHEYLCYLELWQQQQQQQHVSGVDTQNNNNNNNNNTSSSASTTVMTTTTTPLVYMAQNELQKFGDAVQNDVTIPPICTDSALQCGHGHLYHVMLWMGPAGCTSPLHIDPLDNVLMQIVGTKRVVLLDPALVTDPINELYVGPAHGQQRNTSAVNIQAENDVHHIHHPQFWQSSLPQHCMVVDLIPGDVVFVPKQWWHLAQSLRPDQDNRFDKNNNNDNGIHGPNNNENNSNGNSSAPNLTWSASSWINISVNAWWR